MEILSYHPNQQAGQGPRFFAQNDELKVQQQIPFGNDKQ
jgi:hypothetical protein